MRIYTLTNEYATEGRVGGIGMYIAGLKETLGDILCVEAVDIFPIKLALYKKILNVTQKGDEIWAHHVFPVGFAAWALSFLGRTYTIFFHGNDFDTARAHPLRRKLLGPIMRRARHIVANSQALADEINTLYGVEVRVLQPWLPKDAQESLPLNGAIANAGADRSTILTVARFVPRKGFDLLLDAAERLPEYQFVFAGPDNAYAQQLMHRAKERILSNITFHLNPARAQVMNLYMSATYFAMPTRKILQDREGFGIVYLEAQYAGLPVLAVGHKETREAVAPCLHPHLMDDFSIESFLQSLESMDKERVCQKNQDLRDFVEKNHTLDSRAESIHALTI